MSPFHGNADPSDFIFAISPSHTSASATLDDPGWAYWLTATAKGRSNGGKKLARFASLTSRMRELTGGRCNDLHDADIDSGVSGWDSRIEKEMAVRYLNLVPMLYSHKDSPKQEVAGRYATIDTFFTAMNRPRRAVQAV